jgi:methanogenesis imperfect marker protein 11
MKSFSPEELRKIVSDKKWIMGYNNLWAMHDQNNRTVMLVEDYGPSDGFFIEAWRTFHFPRTSSIVQKSYREGGKSIHIISEGEGELDLVPAASPIGISSCNVCEDEIGITFEGVGGGGVSASYSRGIANGVLRVEVHEEGGGRKLGKSTVILPRKKLFLVGVDDTDSEDVGATYSLVHNISEEINSEESRYLIHGNVQLYPFNPNKTRNCFGTVVGFMIDPGLEDQVTSHFKKRLLEETVSDKTAMCTYEGVVVNNELLNYSMRAKSSFIKSVDEVCDIAKRNNVKVYEITGREGIIGAVASIGLFDKPDYASRLPTDSELNEFSTSAND